MTVPTFITLIVAFILLFICIYLLTLIKRKDDDLDFLRKELATVGNNLRFANDTTQKLTAQIDKAQKEYLELQQKFQKNPSYECQQLLANLLSGHALFHIETIDPENIFIRRR